MGDFVTRVRDLGRLFMRTAKEGGEAAAEALEQRAAIQRLAARIRRADRERGDLIKQIGAKVYALHGRGKIRNQDILQDCRSIDALAAEIQELRKEIEKIRAANLDKGLEIPPLADEGLLTDESTEAAEGPSEFTIELEGDEEYVPRQIQGTPMAQSGEARPAEEADAAVVAQSEQEGGETLTAEGPSEFTEEPKGDPDYQSRTMKAAADACDKPVQDEEPNPYDEGS